MKKPLFFILALFSIASSFSLLQTQQSCESAEYTWMFNSNYEATYSFTDDAVNEDPVNWTLNETGGSIDVSDLMDNHAKVLRLNDSSILYTMQAKNNFTGQTSGTAEYWFMTTNSSQLSSLSLYDTNLSNYGSIYVNDGLFKSYVDTPPDSSSVIYLRFENNLDNQGTASSSAYSGGTFSYTTNALKNSYSVSMASGPNYFGRRTISPRPVSAGTVDFYWTVGNLDYTNGKIKYILTDVHNTFSPQYSHFGMYTNVPNTISVYFASQVDLVANLTLREGDTHHITVTWGSLGINLFVDGELLAQNTTVNGGLSSIALYYLGFGKLWTSGGWTGAESAGGKYDNLVLLNYQAASPFASIAPCNSNQWYHVLTSFNTTNKTFEIKINGTNYGTYNITGLPDSFNNLVFKTSANGAQTDYFDAAGYSWDPNYNIGDNLLAACCGDDLSADNFNNVTHSCIDGFVFTGPDISQALCEAQFYTWLSGTITGSSGPCCGDDGVSDTFYNGSISNTTYFCKQGILINQTIDSNNTLCEYYNYTWITEGNYPATYSFESDEIGNFTSHDEIIVQTYINTTAKIIDSIDGHAKVLELHDYNSNSGERPTTTILFDSAKTTGNISLWIRASGDISWMGGAKATLLSGSNIIEFVEIRDYHVEQYNGTQYNYLVTTGEADKWYKIDISFDVPLDRVSYWVDGSFKGTYNMNGAGTSIDRIEFSTGISITTNSSGYFDSIDLSWASNPSRNYVNCCGDDGASDTFYNGTLSTARNFCHQGTYINQGIDSLSTVCSYYNYSWISTYSALMQNSTNSISNGAINFTVPPSTPEQHFIIYPKSGSGYSMTYSWFADDWGWGGGEFYDELPEEIATYKDENQAYITWKLVDRNAGCCGGGDNEWRTYKAVLYPGMPYADVYVTNSSGIGINAGWYLHNNPLANYAFNSSGEIGYFESAGCKTILSGENNYTAYYENSSSMLNLVVWKEKNYPICSYFVGGKHSEFLTTTDRSIRIFSINDSRITDLTSARAIANYYTANNSFCCGDDSSAENFYNSTFACFRGSVCSYDIDYGFDSSFGTADDSCGCSNDGTDCLFSQNYNYPAGSCASGYCQAVSPLGTANLAISRVNYSNLYSNSLSQIKLYLKNNGDGVGVISGINFTGITINSIDYNPNIWPGQEGAIIIQTFTNCSIEGIVHNFNFTIYYADTESKSLVSNNYEILTANPLSVVFLSNHEQYSALQLSPSTQENIQYFAKNNGLSGINLSVTIAQSDSVFSKVVTFTGEYYPSEINSMSFNLAPSSQLFFSNQLYPVISGSGGQYSETLQDTECEHNKIMLSYEYNVVSQASASPKILVADEKTLFELIFELIRQIFN